MTTQLFAYTDGYIINHVAEFVYFKQNELQALYALDNDGYIDSVSRFCQMVISAKSLGFPRGAMPLEAAHQLRDELLTAGKVVPIRSMDWNPFKQHLPAACEWLEKHWEEIHNQIEKDEYLRKSLLGLVKRDFKTYVLYKDKIWYPPHYLLPAQRHIIDEFQQKFFLKHMKTTFEKSPHVKDADELLTWIETLISTHYAIFAYHLNWGARDVGCIYNPGLTRSKLSFFHEIDDPSVDRTVLPYVALSIIKRLKHRSELIAKLIKWPETDLEKRIDEGLAELRRAMQLVDPIERKRTLTKVHESLESKLTRRPKMGLTILRAASSILSPGDAPDKVQDSYETKREAKYFAWLWDISSPSVRHELIREIDRLVGTS